MLVQGEFDGDNQSFIDRMTFFKALGTDVRWFVVVPGLGKQALVEKRHDRFESAINGFFALP
jgi:hypothetical protein